jgi:hypothetical protein
MTNYTRQNVALVSTDKSAFLAAKRRRERDRNIDTNIQTLENKINNLELCVQCLEDKIRELQEK